MLFSICLGRLYYTDVFSYFVSPKMDSYMREIPGSIFSFIISVEDVKAPIT